MRDLFTFGTILCVCAFVYFLLGGEKKNDQLRKCILDHSTRISVDPTSTSEGRQSKDAWQSPP